MLLKSNFYIRVGIYLKQMNFHFINCIPQNYSQEQYDYFIVLMKDQIYVIQQKSMQHQSVPQDHLSIIITTSPIRSHPNTQVIDDAIDSILKQSTLASTPIYIICDGAKVTEENKYKSGVITEESMANYQKFKQILIQKYGNKKLFTIIQREHRHGFAENIKFTMQKYALTKHVMIYQHDHILSKQINFAAVVQMMRKFEEKINYVTFMHANYEKIIPRMVSEAKLKKFLMNLVEKEEGYNVSQNIRQFQKDVVSYFRNVFGLPLMPLNFWYDKVHIASRKFYLDVVFHEEGHYDPNKGKNMKTVSFPEDTFAHCMKFSISNQPQKLLEYGVYILWEDEPVFYHQSGRAFMSAQQKQQYVKSRKKEQNDSQSSSEQQEGNEKEEDIDLSGLMLEDTK